MSLRNVNRIVPRNSAGAPTVSLLPIWRLEMKLAEARAAFKRTEEAHRRAENDLHAAQEALKKRRAQYVGEL